MKAKIYQGKKLTSLSRKLGGTRQLIKGRLQRGWDLEKAVHTKLIVRKKKTPEEFKEYSRLKQRVWRAMNKDRSNHLTKMYRRRRQGKIPREVWALLLKDKEVWTAQHNGMSKSDPVGWRKLLHDKAALIDTSKITDKCLDCQVLFSEVGRCSRNPNYCRNCWGIRYIKKVKSKKESLLYSTKEV